MHSSRKGSLVTFRLVVAICGAGAAMLSPSASHRASAEILYISDTIGAAGRASASAYGAAIASGDAVLSSLATRTRAEFEAVTVPDETGGGVSVSAGLAAASLFGEAFSARSATLDPVAGASGTIASDEPAPATITTMAFDALDAAAFAYEEMTSVFVSPTSATFTFFGETATLRDSHGSAMVATTGGPAAPAQSEERDVSISGHASAETFSIHSSAYTFEVVGPGRSGATITYATQASLDDSVWYRIGLGEDPAQPFADVIGANAIGTLSWTFPSPGVYTLVVAGYTYIDAFVSASNPIYDAGVNWSDAAFDLALWTVTEPAVPEAPTLAMLLLGLIALSCASSAFRVHHMLRVTRSGSRFGPSDAQNVVANSQSRPVGVAVTTANPSRLSVKLVKTSQL